MAQENDPRQIVTVYHHGSESRWRERSRSSEGVHWQGGRIAALAEEDGGFFTCVIKGSRVDVGVVS